MLHLNLFVFSKILILNLSSIKLIPIVINRGLILTINTYNMAHPNTTLINALRKTATLLQQGNHYAWGNHGSCNCGNLLQTVTTLSAKDILTYAHSGLGEWSELAVDYCGVTSAPHTMMIGKLEEIGLTPSDIHNIEYLEDKQVLQQLPGGFKWLSRNNKEDVIVYMNTFANMLEEKLVHSSDVQFYNMQQVQQGSLQQSVNVVGQLVNQ
jgi:DNA-directed RNA polymerase subunit L